MLLAMRWSLKAGKPHSGAEVVHEPTEQPYGVRDCAFRDPRGRRREDCSLPGDVLCPIELDPDRRTVQSGGHCKCLGTAARLIEEPHADICRTKRETEELTHPTRGVSLRGTRGTKETRVEEM